MKNYLLSSLLIIFLIPNIAIAQIGKEKNEQKLKDERPTKKGGVMFNISGGLTFINQSYSIPNAYNSGTNSMTQKGFQINSGISIGYFLINNFMLGVDLSNTYTNSTTKINSTNYPYSNGGTYSRNAQMIGISPFLRYYLPVSKKSAFFPELAFGINAYSESNGSNSATSSILTYRAGLGFSHFINKNVAFSIAGYYTIQSLSNRTNSTIIYNSNTNRIPQLLYGFQLFF